jgi:hypothetical protein
MVLAVHYALDGRNVLGRRGAVNFQDTSDAAHISDRLPALLLRSVWISKELILEDSVMVGNWMASFSLPEAFLPIVPFIDER